MLKGRLLMRRVLLGALLAFVCQALTMPLAMAGRQTQWIEACSPTGIVRVAWHDQGSDQATPDHPDCSWCELLSGAGDLGLSALPEVPRPLAHRADRLPTVAPPASRPAWAQLPIRGPPGSA